MHRQPVETHVSAGSTADSISLTAVAAHCVALFFAGAAHTLGLWRMRADGAFVGASFVKLWEVEGDTCIDSLLRHT